MFVAISALALLASGASAASGNQKQLPAIRARNLGVKAIHRARSKARAARRTQEQDDMDMGDMDLGAMICGFLSLADDAGMAEEGMEGMTCSQFGCDKEQKNLIMNCEMEGEICEEHHDHRHRRTAEEEHGDDVEYCQKDITVEMSIELDFEDKSDIKSKQCGTYTKPAELAALGPGCMDLHVTIDIAGMMEAETTADPNMSEEEAAKMAAEFIEITECSGSFNDGTKCDCGMCDDGMGFTLTCKQEEVVTFLSEECTDFDAGTVTGSIGGSGGDGDEGPSGPSAAILRLSAAKSDAPKEGDKANDGDKVDPASPAASRKEAVGAGVVLASASLLAVM